MACAVMIGVAAEAAFLDLVDSFCGWLPKQEADKLRSQMGKRGTPYSRIHEEFCKRIESHKKSLPPDMMDGLDLQMNAALDLIRCYRNDAGHPTGKVVDRQTCYVSLVLFGHAMQRIFALKAVFDSKSDSLLSHP